MFTLVVVRLAHKRPLFIVRDDTTKQMVFSSYKRSDAYAKQAELSKANCTTEV